VVLAAVAGFATWMALGAVRPTADLRRWLANVLDPAR
jgi:hypothetical protein